MNKTELIHKIILQEKVVNKDDLKAISKKVLGKKNMAYFQRKYLSRLQDDYKIGKIKKGLYYGIPLENTREEFEVDRYILANKIRQGYALGYHSALELHGAAYSAFNTIYVLIQQRYRFQSFQFQHVKYKPIINRFHTKNLKRITYKDRIIKVTDEARTFIECLDRLDLCGGWEECLKSLANLQAVKISNVEEILKSYQNKTLELKAGYVLEILSKTSPYYQHIQTKDLNMFKPSDTWIPVYLDRSLPSRLKRKWGLYVPKGTDELLRGI